MNPETVMKMTREYPPYINSILLLWVSHLKKVTTDFITSGRKNIFKGMNASTSIFSLENSYFTAPDRNNYNTAVHVFMNCFLEDDFFLQHKCQHVIL